MKYYRMNGDIPGKFTGRVLRHGGRVYVNPGAAVLAEAGYKPLTGEPEPSLAPGEAVVAVYTDTGASIVRSWRIVSPGEPTPA